MSAAKRAKRPQNAFFGWVSELVHEHRARLVRIARREGVRGADALDVIQDVFVAFLELPQARSLAGDADGSGRVLSVLTRNSARNQRRRHHRARPHAADPEELAALRRETSDVDALVLAADRHARLVGCIAQLTKIRQRVVTLRLLDEVKGDDVGRALGLTPGHVATLLHRAKADLRDCIERGEASIRPANQKIRASRSALRSR